MSRGHYELRKLTERMDKIEKFIQMFSQYCLSKFLLMEQRFWNTMSKWKQKTTIKMAALEDEIEELKEYKEEQELIIQSLQAKIYASMLPVPVPNRERKIVLPDGHFYSNEFDAFLKHGSFHCTAFYILNGINGKNGFVGYPPDFFENLIKYALETTFPERIIENILIELPLVQPATWPDFNNLEILQKRLDFKRNAVAYEFINKNNSGMIFSLHIWFNDSKNYGKKMCEFFLHKRIKSFK